MNFEQLDKYLHRYLNRFSVQANDIDDIVQASLLKIYQNMDRFDPSKSKLTTWAARIAHNCLVDYKRKKRPKSFGELSQDEEAPKPDAEAPPDFDWNNKDLRYRIDLVLSKIPEKHRVLIQRLGINREQSKALAVEEGITPGAVRWRYAQSKKVFDALWKKYSETVACQCGCETRLPKYNSRGGIRRFARGHARKVSAAERRKEKILCACGCGNWTPAIGKNGSPVRYIEGHVNREKRKYNGSTRAKRMSQSALAKRAERKAAAEAAGIVPEKVITKNCCACNQERPTRWTGNFKADLTPIYHSRCIECNKAYQRDRRKKRNERAA